MEKLKQFITTAQTWFQRLTTRERRLVLGGGGAVLAFAVFVTLFSFRTSTESHRKRIAEKSDRLGQVMGLAASFRDAEQLRRSIEQQLGANSVKLLSFLEERGTASGLDITTYNPKPDEPIGDGNIIESSVELTLTDIKIDKLVNFLSAIERGPGIVKVKYLRVEPRKEQENLTAWTTIATYRLKEGT